MRTATAKPCIISSWAGSCPSKQLTKRHLEANSRSVGCFFDLFAPTAKLKLADLILRFGGSFHVGKSVMVMAFDGRLCEETLMHDPTMWAFSADTDG